MHLQLGRTPRGKYGNEFNNEDTPCSGRFCYENRTSVLKFTKGVSPKNGIMFK